MNGSREEYKGVLEANPFANGIGFSSRPHAPAGIRSPKRKGKWERRLMGLSDLIPKQLPKSTTGTQSVLVTSTLTRYDTEGAD